MKTLPHTSAVGTSPTPPGPPCPWWGLPHLGAMRRDYLGFLAQLQQRYGDIVQLRVGQERMVDVFAPELVRELLVDKHAAHIRWERATEVFAQAMGQSVLVTEGEVWQRQRRMLQPGFTPRRVAGYAGLMLQAAQQALAASLPSQPGQSTCVDVDALMTRLTMDVILRTLFSHPAQPQEAAQAARATQVLGRVAMQEMMSPFTLPDWLPLPGKAQKRWALRQLRELVAGHIRQRQAVAPVPQAAPGEMTDGGSEARADLLAMLLAVRDESTGQGLSAAELHDQCMVMFQAGHETSATALVWWAQLMAEHPEAAQRAQAEVDAVLVGGRPPEPQDLPRLDWLGATLKEAMRLYPPIPALMTRRTLHAITLGGWHIPAGTMLRLTPWLAQRDARYFPEPLAFQPERFAAAATPAPRGAWMPFGTGPRVCIGQHFAMLEMTLVAALLLQNWRLDTLPGQARPEAALNVTLRPVGGLSLRVTRR